MNENSFTYRMCGRMRWSQGVACRFAMNRLRMGRVYNLYRDGRHTLFEFVVAESAAGGADGEIDGCAGSICAARRRGARVFGNGMAGEVERIAGVSEGLRPGRAGTGATTGCRRCAGAAARRLRLRVSDRGESVGGRTAHATNTRRPCPRIGRGWTGRRGLYA